MNANSQGEPEAVRKDGGELVELQREEATIEAEDHDGFVDAARVTRIKSEIEELETDIFHRKIESENGNP